MNDSTVNSVTMRPRKRLFIGLLSLVAVLIVVAAGLALWVPSGGLLNLHPLLPILLTVAVVTLTVLLIGGLLLLVLTLLTGRDLFFSQTLRQIVVRYLFPAIIAFGRLLGINRDTLQQSFIALNNQLIQAKKLRVPASRTLLLLPHCIQLFDCAIKITGDVDKCQRCGRCAMNELTGLAAARGIDIAVASGGTLARKIIVERRPQLIIAVACERDLTAGIRDAYPLPVIGVLNQRPNGPCINTQVVLAELEATLDEYLLCSPSSPDCVFPHENQ
ncbi:MAG: DUF116 domain-containing protein [Desulfuromonadales bacterium]|nr:DUF116 domain-containing protein [Desulfuromonadales bacterium]